MRTIRSALAGAFAITACVASCTRTAGPGESSIDHLPTFVAEEDLRLGSQDDPERGFSRILGVDVGRDGRVYVFELADMQIRVYSPDGRLLRRIGGRGEGPGEFQSVVRFGVVGDTVWTFDIRLRRITLFSRDGALLSTARANGVQVVLGGWFGNILPYHMRADGLFTSDLQGITANPDSPLRIEDPRAGGPVPRVLFDATGTVVDTIGWDSGPPPDYVPPPGYALPERRTVLVGSRRLPVPRPPSDWPAWLALDDGRIVVDAPQPTAAEDAVLTVTRLDLQGDTVYRRALHYTPVSYSAEDLDSVAWRSARTGGGAVFSGGVASAPPGDVEALERAMRAAMEFPALQLPLQGPHLLTEGGLWLHRRDEDAAAGRWILLDADGLPRGELELGRRARPLWSRGDVVWVSEPDDFDVPWLVRYRMLIAGG